MNFDLTKYLGEYGAAIAAAGVAIIYYLNNRTSNNLDTKISNIESMLLKTEYDMADTKARLIEVREHLLCLTTDFEQYRREHP
jgi:hypothetical protein